MRAQNGASIPYLQQQHTSNPQHSSIQASYGSNFNAHEALARLSAAAVEASNPQHQHQHQNPHLNLTTNPTATTTTISPSPPSSISVSMNSINNSTSVPSSIIPTSTQHLTSTPTLDYDRFDEAQLLLNAAMSPVNQQGTPTPDRNEEGFGLGDRSSNANPLTPSGLGKSL